MSLFDGLYLNVGAMKSGTTWLYRQLEQHPAVVFSREKELHFHASRAGDREALDLRYRLGRTRTALQRAKASPLSAAGRDVLGWYLPYLLIPPRSNRWYRRRFPQSVPAVTYCADFSNLTAVIDDAGWANIRSLAARPRISLILRHPMGRVWSHLRFLQQLGVDHAAAASISAAQLDALDERHGLWRHSQYSVIIQKLRHHFDADQVKIFFYDDISFRPLDLLRELESFLDIPAYDYDSDKLERRINRSSGPGLPAPVLEKYAGPLEQELKALQALGLQLPPAWFGG